MRIAWRPRGEVRSAPNCGPPIAANLVRAAAPAHPPWRPQDEALVALLRAKMGWAGEVFGPAVRPLIEGYARFLHGSPGQSPRPAVESPGRLDAGVRVTQALRRASRALDLRRGQILPRGAAPEVIGAQGQRWTYAVFAAALLHDERQAGCAQLLLRRCVSPQVLDWLAADPAVMRELVAYLSGDDSASAGAIAELVGRAAGHAPPRDRRPGGRADPAAQQTAPAMHPPGVKADGAAVGAAVTSARAVAIHGPALPVEETGYLDAVDDGQAQAASPSSAESGLAESGSAPVPYAARRFMAWLRRGLADGTLAVNLAGAPVHGVPEGMLLVSPRIFREFAPRFGADGSGKAPAAAADDPGAAESIQRQFLRAGWHLRAGQGINILSYRVLRGARAASRLSGVVIPNPARFVDPVPPVNPLLVRLPERSGEAEE